MARLIVAGLLVAVATPLLAQPAPAPAPMAPMVMGQTITRAEVQTRVQTQFAKRDANRDGFLTTDEFRGQRQGMKMRQRGQMGGQQAMRDPNAAFDRLDANRDGSISRDEFARNRVVRIERRVVANQPGQPGMENGRMRVMRGGGGMMGGAMLKMADTDRDGRVSLAEATAGALRHFDMMDSNRDGRITPEERAAGRAQMRQMRRAG
jgi:Ca2+-binding EF-hand superfamily protein